MPPKAVFLRPIPPTAVRRAAPPARAASRCSLPQPPCPPVPHDCSPSSPDARAAVSMWCLNAQKKQPTIVQQHVRGSRSRSARRRPASATEPSAAARMGASRRMRPGSAAMARPSQRAAGASQAGRVQSATVRSTGNDSDGPSMYGLQVQDGSIAAQVQHAMLKRGGRSRPASAPIKRGAVPGSGGRVRPGSAVVQRQEIGRYPVAELAPKKFVSAQKRLRQLSARRKREQREFEQALLRDEREQAFAARARISQANVWAKNINFPKHYEAVERGKAAEAPFKVLIMETAPDGGPTRHREVSLAIFNREYDKLKHMVNLRSLHDKAVSDAGGEAAVGLAASPSRSGRFGASQSRGHSPLRRSGGSRGPALPSPGFATTGRRTRTSSTIMTPVVGNYSHTLVVPKHRPASKKPNRAAVQAELRAVLSETAQLTEILQQQLDELRRKGWNKGTRVAPKSGVDYWTI